MLILPSHKPMEQQMEQRIQGKPVSLEPGYQALLEEWENKNANELYLLSAEERTTRFAKHVQNHVEKQMQTLIAEEAKKREAARGKLLLVSLDGGQHFDKVLSLEEVKKEDTLKVFVLSGTLQSTTPNYEEVVEGQEVLHIAKNLEDLHFVVEQIGVEKHVVHVRAIPPKGVISELEIHLKEGGGEWIYEFLGEKKESVPESILPEKFGRAQKDSTLRMPSQPELLTQTILHEQESGNKAARTLAAQAGLATFASFTALNAVAAQKQKEAILALNNTQGGNLLLPKTVHPLFSKVPNVTAAKAAMKAHFARQLLEQKKERNRHEQRQQEVASMAEKTSQTVKATRFQTQKSTSKDPTMKRIASGVGVAGALFTGLVGGGASLILFT